MISIWLCWVGIPCYYRCRWVPRVVALKVFDAYKLLMGLFSLKGHAWRRETDLLPCWYWRRHQSLFMKSGSSWGLKAPWVSEVKNLEAALGCLWVLIWILGLVTKAVWLNNQKRIRDCFGSFSAVMWTGRRKVYVCWHELCFPVLLQVRPLASSASLPWSFVSHKC